MEWWLSRNMGNLPMCFEWTNGCHDHKLLFLRLWHFLYKTGTSQILTSHTLAVGESIAVQVCPDMNVGIHPKDENLCIGYPITRDHQRSSCLDGQLFCDEHTLKYKKTQRRMHEKLDEWKSDTNHCRSGLQKKHSPWLTGGLQVKVSCLTTTNSGTDMGFKKCPHFGAV